MNTIILKKRLKELRIKNNKTQEDIAAILGVSRSTYTQYEITTNKREMDYDTIIKLADYYRVSLDYLFDRTDFPLHKESYDPDEIDFMISSMELYKNIKSKYNL